MRYFDSLKKLDPIKFKEDQSLPILEMIALSELQANIYSLDNKAFFDLAKNTLINKRIDKELFNDDLVLIEIKDIEYKTIFSNIQYLLENAEDVEMVKLAFSLFINIHKFISHLIQINRMSYGVLNSKEFKNLTTIVKLYLLDTHVEEIILSYNLDIKGILKKFYKEKEQYYQYLKKDKKIYEVYEKLCSDTINSLKEICSIEEVDYCKNLFDYLPDQIKRLKDSFEYQSFLKCVFSIINFYDNYPSKSNAFFRQLNVAFEYLSFTVVRYLDFDDDKVNTFITLLFNVSDQNDGLYILMCLLISFMSKEQKMMSLQSMAIFHHFYYVLFEGLSFKDDIYRFFFVTAFRRYFDLYKDIFKKLDNDAILSSAFFFIHSLTFNESLDYYILGYIYSQARNESDRCLFLGAMLSPQEINKTPFEHIISLGKRKDRYVSKGISLYIYSYILNMDEPKLAQDEGEVIVSILNKFPPRDVFTLDLNCFFLMYLDKDEKKTLSNLLNTIDGVKLIEQALKAKKPLDTSLFHIRSFYSYTDNTLFIERFNRSPHENMTLIESIAMFLGDDELDSLFQTLDKDLESYSVPTLKNSLYLIPGSLNCYSLAIIPNLLKITGEYYPNIYRYGVISPMFLLCEKYVENLLSLDVNLFINDDVLFDNVALAIHCFEVNHEVVSRYYENVDTLYEFMKLKNLSLN